jgi:hypothetical protein
MILLVLVSDLKRSKAILFPSGDHAGTLSLQPVGGWVIWRTWLPSGFITKSAPLVWAALK